MKKIYLISWIFLCMIEKMNKKKHWKIFELDVLSRVMRGWWAATPPPGAGVSRASISTTTQGSSETGFHILGQSLILFSLVIIEYIVLLLRIFWLFLRSKNNSKRMYKSIWRSTNAKFLIISLTYITNAWLKKVRTSRINWYFKIVFYFQPNVD